MDFEEWNRKIDRERELRSKLARIGECGNRVAQRNAAREWFGHVAVMLRDCARAPDARDRPLRPPTELLVVLADLLTDLGRGSVSQLFTDVTSHGATRRGKTEERHIGYATLYLLAVERGEIEDKTPVKTIQDCYGVGRSTVYGWKKLTVPEVIQLDYEEMGPEWLATQIRDAGEIYRRAGRTGIAAARRGKRR